MTELEILNAALVAQAENGPTAAVAVLLPRLPNSRYVKQMRIRKTQGPWGRVIALATEGARVEFEAHKLIKFFSISKLSEIPKQIQSRSGRVKIHPFIKAENAQRLNEIAEKERITMSALIDSAVTEYVQRYA